MELALELVQKLKFVERISKQVQWLNLKPEIQEVVYTRVFGQKDELEQQLTKLIKEKLSDDEITTINEFLDTSAGKEILNLVLDPNNELNRICGDFLLNLVEQTAFEIQLSLMKKEGLDFKKFLH